MHWIQIPSRSRGLLRDAGLCLLLSMTTITGCQELQQENSLLVEENQTLRTQLSTRNSALDDANSQLREKEALVADLNREAELAGMLEPIETTDPFAGIEGVTGTIDAGEITATIEGDLLFSSGSASLKTAAKSSLDTVVQTIASEYPGRSIRISGHTDTDKIKKSPFKSNYHLGFERAWAVRNYIISRGINENLIHVASFGASHAQSTKARSRRVEIAIILNE